MPTTIETPYGPLVANLYAGPTSDGATTYARDGKYPQTAHVFGREPEPTYVGARVQTADGEPLTINGVAYRVSTSWSLTDRGWIEDREASWHALSRQTAYGFWSSDDVTDAARKAYRERISDAVGVALVRADITQAVADARAEYVKNIRARIDELRQEAARLESIIAHESMLPMG